MQNPSILLVDDDVKILKQFQNVLSKTFETTLASSGNEALSKIKHESFDAIVSDFNMNDGDGLFLLENLNKQNSKAPLILVSGHANSDIAIKFANLHVFKILEKPVSPSELKKATEEAITFYNKVRMEDKMKRIGENTSQMLHDVKNNMFLISATAEVGMESTPSELIKKQFARTLKACQKITDIFSRYKNFLHSDVPIKLENHSVNDFVKNFHEDVKDGLSNVSFRYDLPQTDVFVAMDKELMYQVLMNLLSNSRDSLQNHKKPEIQIEVQSSMDRVSIYFKDNGPGIDPGIATKLFKERASTKGDKGTGMGLTYCKQIMDLHLGDIEAVPSESGACFKIQLLKKN